MKITVERDMMEMIRKLEKFHLAVTDSTWSVVVKRIRRGDLKTLQLTFTDTDLTLPTRGLRGCILSALLGQQEVSLFDDAVTGQDVTECDSAVCSKSPCHNGGVCNQVGPAATGIIKLSDKNTRI